MFKMLGTAPKWCHQNDLYRKHHNCWHNFSECSPQKTDYELYKTVETIVELTYTPIHGKKSNTRIHTNKKKSLSNLIHCILIKINSIYVVA